MVGFRVDMLCKQICFTNRCHTLRH